MRVVGGDGAERGRADAVGLVPLADRDAGPRPGWRRACCDRARSARMPSSPASAEPRRLAAAAQHRQHVGERDVRPVQSPGVAALLGELAGPCRAARGPRRRGRGRRGPLPSTVSARSSASRAPTARASASACSQIRQRLLVAPGQHQPVRERRQRLRALRRGRLRRHELDRALERGEGGVAAAAREQVAAEAARAGARRAAGRSRRRARSLAARARPRAARHPSGWPARRSTSRARRGRAPRARPRPARRPTARAPARGARAPRPGRRRPPPRVPPRPTPRAPRRCDPPPPSAARAPPALAAALRASSSASRACSSSRSPGRIVA